MYFKKVWAAAMSPRLINNYVRHNIPYGSPSEVKVNYSLRKHFSEAFWLFPK